MNKHVNSTMQLWRASTLNVVKYYGLDYADYSGVYYGCYNDSKRYEKTLVPRKKPRHTDSF